MQITDGLTCTNPGSRALRVVKRNNRNGKSGSAVFWTLNFNKIIIIYTSSAWVKKWTAKFSFRGEFFFGQSRQNWNSRCCFPFFRAFKSFIFREIIRNCVEGSNRVALTRAAHSHVSLTTQPIRHNLLILADHFFCLKLLVVVALSQPDVKKCARPEWEGDSEIKCIWKLQCPDEWHLRIGSIVIICWGCFIFNEFVSSVAWALYAICD